MISRLAEIQQLGILRSGRKDLQSVVLIHAVMIDPTQDVGCRPRLPSHAGQDKAGRPQKQLLELSVVRKFLKRVRPPLTNYTHSVFLIGRDQGGLLTHQTNARFEQQSRLLPRCRTEGCRQAPFKGIEKVEVDVRPLFRRQSRQHYPTSPA